MNRCEGAEFSVTCAVQGENGEVLGVLTRDSVVRALEDQLL